MYKPLFVFRVNPKMKLIPPRLYVWLNITKTSSVSGFSRESFAFCQNISGTGSLPTLRLHGYGSESDEVEQSRIGL